MKLFWLKNKVLIAAMCAMLVLGVVFWGGLNLFAQGSMQDRYIRTAQAEAEATDTPAPQGAEGAEPAQPTPVPTSDPETEKAEEARVEAYVRELRFASIIPRIDNIVPFDCKTWAQGDDPEPELQTKAFEQVKALYKTLFNWDIDTKDLLVAAYVDTAGYRDDILRITDGKNTHVCVLLKKDLSPLAISTIRYVPQKAATPKQDAAKVAQLLGTQVNESKAVQDRGGSRGRVNQSSYSVALADGRYVQLAYTENGLMGVKVHPDEYSMEESVCFQADIRHNSKVVHLVAEENFEQGDIHSIAEGDMSVDQVSALYRKFLSAANGRASERRDAEGKSMEELDYNLKDWDITYFLDKSGYRENFYRINNDFVHMDIAAKSGYIVRAECNELYNPDDGLKLIDIDYDHMGGPEYEAYMRHVIDMTFGPDSYDSIGVNAVYDGDFCTMDADMKDGCTYEFGFAGGRLMYVEHYLYGLDGIPGWFADNLYVNTITGEEFYQTH